jgi:hypothetical protein
MNKDTTVIVDHGCALFGNYQASFFCKGEITVESILAEVSKRMGVPWTTTGSDEEFHSITIVVL